MSRLTPSQLHRHHVGDVADAAGDVVVPGLTAAGQVDGSDDWLGSVAQLGAIAEFGGGSQVEPGRHGTGEGDRWAGERALASGLQRRLPGTGKDRLTLQLG